MREPPKQNDLNLLVPYVKDRAMNMLIALRARGFQPKVVETRRSIERQRWLYGQGRSPAQLIRRGVSPLYSHPGPIVTHTLKSRHIVGKALDVIDGRSGYDNPRFFNALSEEAARVGLSTPYAWDRAHVEWCE